MGSTHFHSSDRQTTTSICPSHRSQTQGEEHLSKSKTPEPLYRQFTPEEDRGKTRVSKYYRVNQNMDSLGTGLHPYNIECNLRIDFDLDGGIYKVEWSNKVLGERK